MNEEIKQDNLGKNDEHKEIVENEKKSKLNPRQERFCVLYASDKEFFANGVQSYIEAYSTEDEEVSYATAKTTASRMLSNLNILNRINELLDMRGMNDPFVDKQLEFVITQNTDLSVKVQGIREYNKLKSRIEEKVKHTVVTEDVLTPEQLDEIILRKKKKEDEHPGYINDNKE